MLIVSAFNPSIYKGKCLIVSIWDEKQEVDFLEHTHKLAYMTRILIICLVLFVLLFSNPMFTVNFHRLIFFVVKTFLCWNLKCVAIPAFNSE